MASLLQMKHILIVVVIVLILKNDVVNCQNSNCLPRADVTFIVDTSGSITAGFDNWTTLRSFLKSVVSKFTTGLSDIRFGFVSFSTVSLVEFYLDQSYSYLETLTAIQYLTYQGGKSNIADALSDARSKVFQEKRGDRADVPNLAVVITDGTINVKNEGTLEALKALQTVSKVVAVSVTDSVDMLLLKNLSVNQEHVIEVKSFDTLKNSTQMLLDAMNVCLANTTGRVYITPNKASCADCDTTVTTIQGCDCIYKWLTIAFSGILGLLLLGNLLCCCTMCGCGRARRIRYPERTPIEPVKQRMVHFSPNMFHYWRRPKTQAQPRSVYDFQPSSASTHTAPSLHYGRGFD